MSNLIPTPRADKHGVVVTRHMKLVQPSKVLAAMPAPQIAVAMGREQQLEAIDRILEDVDGSRVSRIIRELSDADVSMLLSRLERRDDKFSDWVVRSFRIGKEHRGIAMVECHDFFSACYAGAPFKLAQGMNVIYNVIGDGDELIGRPTPFNIGNIKVEFLRKRLHMERDSGGYSSPHDYYRDIELLRANLETIEPALPFLSIVADALVLNPFKDSTAVIDAAKRFASVPEEKFPAIHDFLMQRGGAFDAGLVEQIIENDTRALHDGLL